MADTVDALDDALIEWIDAQQMFFVASAPSDGGHVNLSPKGHDTLRVLGPTKLVYLDLTGSGAETIAHARQNGRLTVMFCAFEGPPRILRLYGTGSIHPLGSDRFDELIAHFDDEPGARAIIELDIARIQTSCGYSVPLMEYQRERPTLRQWSARRSEAELATYRREHNTQSIDGLPALTDEA
ncbi:MAG: pyridoxamine 5'-phosphate oxidase family protein [Acidimicrobiales bacterium]